MSASAGSVNYKPHRAVCDSSNIRQRVCSFEMQIYISRDQTYLFRYNEERN